jgi:hypothetical protein
MKADESYFVVCREKQRYSVAILRTLSLDLGTPKPDTACSTESSCDSGAPFSVFLFEIFKQKLNYASVQNLTHGPLS